ncbi:penicillin-binding protein 1B [Thalassotalea insulae]|uniref:Penicillin-binding protein 1B n=1 Tax=Thalassotalea insulae TaxID=2056778 RepID=A0ABQ6GSU5_9GAMM|nr:penicillin-binding protein 1B [Thalassotalea insulae]GLX79020.1 penicillin-binding protein 1B [Thalassotalea insulae]
MVNKKSSATEQTPAIKTLSKRRRFFVFSLKLLLIGIVLLAFYTLYLDSKVVAKFEGQRWQVPVQVYGKVAHFQLGDDINLEHIKQELVLTGYQRVTEVKQAGQFALSKKRIIIYRRPFDFGSGIEDSQQITIDINKSDARATVERLMVDNTDVNVIELEPYLIDRIVPENKEDRVLVPLQSVPEKLLDTLLLVEDREFYFHAGISPLGILRALYNNVRAGRTVQGGSTLTQQLVKNMYLTRDKTLWRKVNEAIMALLLEYRYSKDQLLEAYINEVYLGQHFANGIYGFGLAAEFYFGRSVAQLTNEQMATLIGVIKGPSYYDPWRYQHRVKTRRDLVLKLMFEQEFLTKSEYVAAVESDLSVRQSRRLKPSKQKFPNYIQLVKRELSELLLPEEQASGIRVFTTFSPYSQQLAEHSVKQQLAKLAKSEQHQLQAAMLVTDRATGEIKALVGDKNSGYAGFNRALNAKRPIGSLIKPAIYLAALERYQEYQLGSLLDDKPISFEMDNGEVWQPKNYSGKFYGQVSLHDSLVKSLNIPTVNLGMAIGLEHIADLIHMLGYDEDIALRPSMLLGSINMSPYQVNQFYLPFANHGEFVKSHVVESIVSPQGETLYRYQNESIPYFSEQASYLTDYALTHVATEGTAKSLSWRLKNHTVAGKTGTTNDQRDSWFVGYDDQHLVTVWLGRDDNKATEFTGSSGALTLFADFISQFGVVDKAVKVPANIEAVSFEQATGYPLAVDCDNSIDFPAVNIGLAYQYSCSELSDKPKKERSWFERLFG